MKSNKNGNVIINNIINGESEVGNKSKYTAIMLCLLGYVGIAGLHKFYEGKILMGILYLGTIGFLGVGTFIDLIALIAKPRRYTV